MENYDIPMNADHWLFAEDLVNFIFRRHENFPIEAIAGECREFVREGFTEIVRSAVAIIENNMRTEIDAMFAEMSLKADVMEEYKAYVSNLRSMCGSSGFDGNKFLHYSVHVACLGERFYRTGVEEFHFLAFTSVREALERYDMISGGWDTLDLVADKITSVEEHLENLPSPEYRLPDHELNILNENPENRTWILLNEKAGSSSESTSRQNSSEENSDGSNKNTDDEEYVSESESDYAYSEKSSPKHLISIRSKSSQSNTSSSTTTEELGNARDSSSQEEKNGSGDSSSNHAFNHSIEEKPLPFSNKCRQISESNPQLLSLILESQSSLELSTSNGSEIARSNTESSKTSEECSIQLNSSRESNENFFDTNIETLGSEYPFHINKSDILINIHNNSKELSEINSSSQRSKFKSKRSNNQLTVSDKYNGDTNFEAVQERTEVPIKPYFEADRRKSSISSKYLIPQRITKDSLQRSPEYEKKLKIAKYSPNHRQ